MKRKWLAVGIILLFVGVTITPSINFNTVKASQEDDLVEVTTQACGIQGYDDTTVKLTRQQYQNLEQYLVEFRARLNQTTTKAEAVPLFKEAVVELDRYGLLPKGMSVERAQRLILSMYSNTQNRDLLEKILRKNQEDRASDNFFCLITGSCTNSVSFPLLYSLASMIYFSPPWDEPIPFIFGLFLISAYGLSDLRAISFPFYLCGEICFGWLEVGGYGNSNSYHSEGSISSIGLNGKRNWSGNFYGDIRRIPIPRFAFEAPQVYYYSGVVGFTGLTVWTSESKFIIGSCLSIQLGD